jgi:hypothetical protein
VLGFVAFTGLDGGASGRELRRFGLPVGSYAKPKSIGTKQLELVEER